MLQPYKHIQESEKVLKTLVNEFKTMDNAKTRLTELNVLIKTINSYKEMLKENYYTEYLDILILSRLKQSLFLENPKEDLNIAEFELYLKQDIEQGREFQVWNITDFIQTHQLNNSLKKGLVFQDTKEDLKKLIESNLQKIKANIVWLKRIKK